MAFNGTGTFLKIYNWEVDRDNKVPIKASRFNEEINEIATGLSNCITKDGQTVITANISLNGNKLTNVGSGTDRTNTINVSQVQDNQFKYLGTTGGGADVYTLAPSPTITAYAATQQFTAKISATNLTTTPYLQISSIASPATTAVIKKLSATKTEIAVEASDLLINGIYDFKRNSANDAWIVLNPEKAFYDLTNSTLPIPITIANNATDADNDIDFIAVATTMSKRLDASWTAGTNQGGLFSGSKANSTWYHCFAIYNLTTGVSDYGFDTSVIATNRPANYTKYKRVGSIKTNASGNILPFTQLNINEFYYATDILETTTLGTPDTNNFLLTTTPLGISTKALIMAKVIATTSGVDYQYIISSPIIQGNKGVIIGAGTQADATQVLQEGIYTDTSSRIYQNGSTYTSLAGGVFTTGYIDYTL